MNEAAKRIGEFLAARDPAAPTVMLSPTPELGRFAALAVADLEYVLDDLDAQHKYRERPARERLADLLREADIQTNIDLHVSLDENDDPVTSCGGLGPPCGGCDRCLITQITYYAPDREAYLRQADAILSGGTAIPETEEPST